MALSLVTLKWDFGDLIESGVAATLAIAPTTQLEDPVDHVFVSAVPRQVTFTGAGQLAGIVALDSANLTPAGQGYVVTVTTAAGQVIYSETVQILIAGGATQWLDTLATFTASPVVTSLPVPTGTPQAGQVPVATGTGEASAWAAMPGYGGPSLNGLGLALATMDIASISGNLGATAQRLYCFLCTAQETVTVTKLGAWLEAAGVTPGAGVNGLALYTEAGSLMAATADMTAAFEQSVTTNYVPAEGTLTSSQNLTAGSNYYLALLENFTGTSPAFAAGTSLGVAYPVINGHYPVGVLGGQASFPGSITPSAIDGSTAVRIAFVYAR